MIKQLAVCVMFLSMIPMAYAEPVESLSVFFPSVGQMWREITVFVSICDGRYNPECEYGMHKTPLSAEYIITISNDSNVIETFEGKTSKWGDTSVPIFLNSQYEEKKQYEITVTSGNDTKSSSFWTFQKGY